MLNVRNSRALVWLCVAVCFLPAVAKANQLSLESNFDSQKPRTNPVVAIVPSPPGWSQFCKRHKNDCDSKSSWSRDVVLTTAARAALLQINLRVNRAIKPLTDKRHWGVKDRWDYPDDGYGDCEDYALEKRRQLIEAGWPREALLMTVVRGRAGEEHAILTVTTTSGDYILDNLTDHILPWDQTDYKFLWRQAQFDPNIWVALGDAQSLGLIRIDRSRPPMVIAPQKSLL